MLVKLLLLISKHLFQWHKNTLNQSEICCNNFRRSVHLLIEG